MFSDQLDGQSCARLFAEIEDALRSGSLQNRAYPILGALPPAVTTQSFLPTAASGRPKIGASTMTEPCSA